MRFLFDVVSSVVLGVALLSIVGGLGFAGLGILTTISDDGGREYVGGFAILWGLLAFVQGCLFAMIASYCQLRVEAQDR